MTLKVPRLPHHLMGSGLREMSGIVMRIDGSLFISNRGGLLSGVSTFSSSLVLELLYYSLQQASGQMARASYSNAC